jgi:hypothetical protein
MINKNGTKLHGLYIAGELKISSTKPLKLKLLAWEMGLTYGLKTEVKEVKQ